MLVLRELVVSGIQCMCQNFISQKGVIKFSCNIFLNLLYSVAKGVGEQSKAGLISSIAQDAEKLNMSSNQTPVVAIETDSG